MEAKKEAAEILKGMFEKFMKNVTPEQWQTILEETKQARIKLDGVVLEGAELEETVKANIMTRLAASAMNKGR